MQLHSHINQENLHILITSFYKQVLQDDQIGHFFIHEIGDDIQSAEWQEHIDLLVDFWSSKLLNEGHYEGNFVGMHVHIPYIAREDFVRWIEVFSENLDRVYEPSVAEPFKKQSVGLSEKFIRELEL